MNTRITIDLHDLNLLRLLRLEAAQEGTEIREVVVRALEGYFSSRKENRSIMKLAEKVFSEWDNPKDSDYDRL